MGRLTEYFATLQRRKERVGRTRLIHAIDHMPRTPGPLEPGFTLDGLTRRKRAAAKATQLLAEMRGHYDACNRTAYDRLVPKFDAVCDVLDRPLPNTQADERWGHTVRVQCFPDWTTDELHTSEPG